MEAPAAEAAATEAPAVSFTEFLPSFYRVSQHFTHLHIFQVNFKRKYDIKDVSIDCMRYAALFLEMLFLKILLTL